MTAQTLDPTFDLLDMPIALGHADDAVLTAPAPSDPVVDGRKVEDPRLIAALSVPTELTRVDVLDRSAKLGGVLRVLGADGASRLIIEADAPEPARTFAIFAAVRIGLLVHVVAPAADGSAGSVMTIEEAPPKDAETLTLRALHDGEDQDSDGQSAIRTAVRSVRSHFEGVAIEGGGLVRDLDRLMRDSRIESVPSRPRNGERPAIVVGSQQISLAEATDYLRTLLTL